MPSIEIVTLLSACIVVGSSLFLIGLAVVIVSRPPLAERFLVSFASSARAHYMEQGSRLLVGAALLDFAPLMWFPELFRVFGWILVISAVGLLLLPWRWHQKFGAWAIPFAIRHLWLIAVGALALGGLILYGVSRALIPCAGREHEETVDDHRSGGCRHERRVVHELAGGAGHSSWGNGLRSGRRCGWDGPVVSRGSR